MKYFAYGSNLNNKDLESWCKRKNKNIPKMTNPTIIKLENFAIGFTRRSITRGGGVADIISREGDFCYGVAFDIPEEDFKILDKKEGARVDGTGSYKRIRLPNNMITYEVVTREADFVKPTKEYLDTIIEGAKNHNLPIEWIEKLESFRERE